MQTRPQRRSRYSTRVILPAVLLAALLALAGAPPGLSKVFLTVEEALDLAFPGAEITERTVFLSEEQLVRAEELAGVEIPSALVRAHVARRDGELVGTAYFDAHRVRTLPETLMIVVDPEGRVERVEVLSFNEPEDYLPREIWYDQLLERPLDEELRLGRGIRPVTGATLTARATTQATRRALAVHRVLAEDAGGGTPEEGGER
jgi:hypothetical protein